MYGFEVEAKGATPSSTTPRQALFNEYAQAEASYQRSLELTQQLQSIDGQSREQTMASTYHNLGIVAQWQRQWDQAERYYQQTLQFKIDSEQAGTYNQLGVLAMEQHQWEQAKQYYERALQIATDSNDLHERAQIYNNLGALAEEQRQWKRAESYYRQALQIAVGFDDLHEQAQIYHNLGVLARSSGSGSKQGTTTKRLCSFI